jgi:hypothetical protein
VKLLVLVLVVPLETHEANIISIILRR